MKLYNVKDVMETVILVMIILIIVLHVGIMKQHQLKGFALATEVLMLAVMIMMGKLIYGANGVMILVINATQTVLCVLMTLFQVETSV